VTAAVSANNFPCVEAEVVDVMDACAIIWPTNFVVVPSVADDPTCQKTLHGEPKLITLTWEADDVTSVDPIWNTQIARGFDLASNVRVPVK